MNDRSLEAVCPECGRALSFHPWEERPARCEPCFDGYLRGIDHDFLASYAELGVASRRVVAETCLRALVLETPPARKVLALTIIEQFVLANSDLIGLYFALKERRREPIVRSFLGFQLDAETSQAFFAELQDASEGNLLDALGLPPAEGVPAKFPSLGQREAKELTVSIQTMLADLHTTGQRSDAAHLLGELAGTSGAKSGAALASQTSWLPEDGMRPDQVASLVLDERRRVLRVQAVPVDEDRLAEVVDAVGCMTGAASNMIYAYLTVQDLAEESGKVRRST